MILTKLKKNHQLPRWAIRVNRDVGMLMVHLLCSDVPFVDLSVYGDFWIANEDWNVSLKQ